MNLEFLEKLVLYPMVYLLFGVVFMLIIDPPEPLRRRAVVYWPLFLAAFVILLLRSRENRKNGGFWGR